MASERQIERQEAFRARREAIDEARRRRLHPCPTCLTATGPSGFISRTYGRAVADDPETEASAVLPCPTCEASGVRPKHGRVVVLRRDERPAEWWERWSVEREARAKMAAAFPSTLRIVFD